MTGQAHDSATDIGLSEVKLIIPRRNFLIRALGFTAAGAAVSVPIVTMASAHDRLEHHLKGVEAAMREIFPGQAVSVRGNCRAPRDANWYREYFAQGGEDSACLIVSAGPRVML